MQTGLDGRYVPDPRAGLGRGDVSGVDGAGPGGEGGDVSIGEDSDGEIASEDTDEQL